MSLSTHRIYSEADQPPPPPIVYPEKNTAAILHQILVPVVMVVQWFCLTERLVKLQRLHGGRYATTATWKVTLPNGGHFQIEASVALPCITFGETLDTK